MRRRWPLCAIFVISHALVSDPTATCRSITNVLFVKSVCLSLSNLVKGALGASGTFGVVIDTTLGQTPVTPLLTFTDNACIGECFNPCGGDSTCSSHGFCVKGSCRCVGAWSGSRCETPIGGSGFTTCVPFSIGAFSFRPCVNLVVSPCNISWALYADAQSTGIVGTIPLRSVPSTLTASSSFALVTITPVAGCTCEFRCAFVLLRTFHDMLMWAPAVQLSLTELVFNPTTSLLSGNVTGSASCQLVGSAQRSVPFASEQWGSPCCGSFAHAQSCLAQMWLWHRVCVCCHACTACLTRPPFLCANASMAGMGHCVIHTPVRWHAPVTARARCRAASAPVMRCTLARVARRTTAWLLLWVSRLDCWGLLRW